MASHDFAAATRSIRHEIISSAMSLFLLAATALFFGCVALSLAEDRPLAPWHVGLYAVTVAGYLLRRRIRDTVLGALMMAVVYLTAVSDLVSNGIYGSGVTLLLGFTFMGGLFFGVTLGVVSFWIGLLTVGLVAASMQVGWVEYTFDAQAILNSPLSWVSAVAAFVAVALMIYLQTSRSVVRLGALMREQVEQADSLRSLNARLQAEIDERMRAESLLRDSEQRYRDVFSMSPDPLFIVLDGRIADLNAAATALLGLQYKDQALGTELGHWICDDSIRLPQGDEAEPGAGCGLSDLPTLQVEVRVRAHDGRIVTLELGAAVIRFDGVPATLVTARDVSERRSAQQRILHLAHHDALTNLPNRTLLEARLEQALEQAHAESGRLAVLFIDLDRFKTINDTLGHSIGDRLLIEVGVRIASVLRPSDLLARLGGDEFVVLLNALECVEHVTTVAERILDVLRAPVRIDDLELAATPSIGISVYPEDGTDGSALLKHADAAMYHAKASGRNTFEFFAPEMNRAALDRIALEQRLRQGLKDDQFELHFQPQLDFDGRCTGVEALLRWTIPGEGPVAPDRFIPVAEESGLIDELGGWVLRTACRQARAWLDDGIDGLRLAVNVSARQLRQRDLPDLVRGLIEQHRLPPGTLKLEITESAAMESPREAIQTLGQLKDMGVALAIDDFGTGYSSLSYLKLFPLDYLKIDRAFVRDLLDDPDDQAIARGTIALAHSIGLKVVAEGVETEAQVEVLRELGCDEMQGFLFGGPMPANAALAFVRDRRASRPRLAQPVRDVFGVT